MEIGSHSPASRQDFPMYNSMEFEQDAFGAQGEVGEASPGRRRPRGISGWAEF